MKAIINPGKIKALLLALGMLSFGGFLAACEDDPFEEAGENIDEAAEEIDEEF
jgi:hypothetical protein